MIAKMPTLNAEGKIDKTALLWPPIEDGEGEHGMTTSAQQRRLNALQPWIAAFDLESLSR